MIKKSRKNQKTYQASTRLAHLLFRDLELTSVDLCHDIGRVLTVDGAANGVGSAKNLLAGSGEGAGHGAGAHHTCNFNNLVEVHVAVVLDVLGAGLAVACGLLEGLDDHGGGTGDKLNLSLTVLDDELDSDLESLPVEGGSLNVLTNLLGGETKGTNLGGKSGSGTDLTTDGTHGHNLNVILFTQQEDDH